MSRHHPDLVLCRRQPGITTGRLCSKCDGKCPVCDSYVRPSRTVRICDDCASAVRASDRSASTSAAATTSGAVAVGNDRERCIVCGASHAIGDAYYCAECVRLENDREGCPRVINVAGSSKDLYFEKKKRAQMSGGGSGGGGGRMAY